MRVSHGEGRPMWRAGGTSRCRYPWCSATTARNGPAGRATAASLTGSGTRPGWQTDAGTLGTSVALPARGVSSVASNASSAKIETIVALCKRRGFVFASGEIYGGTRSAWDYGPLGVELKENIKRQWWKSMVTVRDDVVGLDSSVILPRQVWVASGHVGVFTDPLVECLNRHQRFRADHLQEAYVERTGKAASEDDLSDVPCPNCGTRGQYTAPKAFSGLLKTHLGPVETEEGLAYLRPETAQGIFINFLNVQTTARKKPPFGIGQMGK